MAGNDLVATSVENSGTYGSEKQCGPCSFSDKTATASSWCKRCSEAMCESCTANHKGFRHEIVPIEKIASLDSLVDEPCMKHTGKILEVYCVDHKEMCCVICLATAHRKCGHISTFEEMVSGSNDSESVEQFADSLNEIKKKTDGLRIKTDETLTQMNTRHKEISMEVAITVQQAKKKIDNLQSNFQTEFQQMHEKESGKLSKKKEKIEEFLKNVEKGQKLLKEVREHGTPKQVFITKERLKVQVKQQVEGLEVDLAGTHCVGYNLKTDCIVTSILNTLTAVAEVEVEPTLEISPGLSEVVDQLTTGEKHKPIDVMKIEVKKVNCINPGGEITGGTFLPDGRLVLCCYSNQAMKVYDNLGIYLFQMLCGNSPRDVCLMPPSETNILVSLYGQNILRKYEIQQNAMKETGTIPCKPGSWGLTATKENIIVGYVVEVDVMSMNGQVIRSFSRSGDSLLSCVSVSLSGNVYYTDNNNIVCATLDGAEVRRFKHPNQNRLSGIAVDKFDNVYACSYYDNNVAVFSSDGKTCKILETNIGRIYKLCLDSTETKLVLTTSSEGVQCYTLKNQV